MGFSKYFSEQAKRPAGLFGRFVMSMIFDRGNKNLNQFVYDLMIVQKNDQILEIGFGTGKLINEMAKKIETGFIEGVDFSKTMISIARRNNKKHITESKVKLLEGDFNQIPFDRNRFTKICTINTIYFWPDAENTIKKVVNILKPQGKFIAAFEDIDRLKEKSLSDEVFHLYSTSEIKALFIRSGFTSGVDIKTREKGSSTYHCVVGTK